MKFSIKPIKKEHGLVGWVVGEFRIDIDKNARLVDGKGFSGFTIRHGGAQVGQVSIAQPDSLSIEMDDSIPPLISSAMMGVMMDHISNLKQRRR